MSTKPKLVPPFTRAPNRYAEPYPNAQPEDRPLSATLRNPALLSGFKDRPRSETRMK